MREFAWFGNTFVVKDGLERYNKICLAFEKVAGMSVSRFKDQYMPICRDMVAAREKVPVIAQQILETALEGCVKILNDYRIYDIDVSFFARTYAANSLRIWQEAQDTAFAAYDENVAELLEQMQVGPYSKVLPTLKRGAVARIRYELNNREMSKNAHGAQTLLDGIYDAVYMLHVDVIQALHDKKGIEFILPAYDETDRALVLLSNLKKDIVAEEDQPEVVAEILSINPYLEDAYYAAFVALSDPRGELQAIAEFFGRGDELKSYKDTYIKDIIDEYDNTSLAESEQLETAKNEIEDACSEYGMDPTPYIVQLKALSQNYVHAQQQGEKVQIKLQKLHENERVRKEKEKQANGAPEKKEPMKLPSYKDMNTPEAIAEREKRQKENEQYYNNLIDEYGGKEGMQEALKLARQDVERKQAECDAVYKKYPNVHLFEKISNIFFIGFMFFLILYPIRVLFGAGFTNNALGLGLMCLGLTMLFSDQASKNKKKVQGPELENADRDLEEAQAVLNRIDRDIKFLELWEDSQHNQ